MNVMLSSVLLLVGCGIPQAIADNPYSKAANEEETKARQNIADVRVFAECYVKEYLSCVDMAIAEYDFCQPQTRLSETCSIKAEELCSE